MSDTTQVSPKKEKIYIILCILPLSLIYFALDEITNDFVVEVIDRTPLDPLLHVLLLQNDTQKQIKCIGG